MKWMILILLFWARLVGAQETSSDSASVAESPADGKTGIKIKKIRHPGAKEGLYLIDEEGVYHYRVETLSKKDHAMFIHFISLSTPKITGEDDSGSFTFNDVYHTSQLTGLEFVYEWQALKGFGKTGLQIGAAFSTASGKGRFKNRSLSSLTPRESYTFFSVPLFVGAVYRFEYMDRQWLAPYISGGGIYNGLLEYRNDGKYSAVGTVAAYGAGGALINLTALNKELAFTMDREYGFSQLWLTAEFKRIQGLNKDLDITANQISVGIGADY